MLRKCLFIPANAPPIGDTPDDPITPQTTWPLEGASNHPIIHNITPKLAQAYNIFSFHCQIKQSGGIFNFKPSENALNDAKYHTIKVSNKLNWYLKKKVPCCYVENDVTRFHYPVFMSKKLFTSFHPHEYNLAGGVITPQNNAGGWQVCISDTERVIIANQYN